MSSSQDGMADIEGMEALEKDLRKLLGRYTPSEVDGRDSREDFAELLRVLGMYTSADPKIDYFSRKTFEDDGTSQMPGAKKPGHITTTVLLTTNDLREVALVKNNNYGTGNQMASYFFTGGGHEVTVKPDFHYRYHTLHEHALHHIGHEGWFGFDDVEFLNDGDIFDVGKHSMPAVPDFEPEHFHYDLRFLARLKSPTKPEFLGSLSARNAIRAWLKIDEDNAEATLSQIDDVPGGRNRYRGHFQRVREHPLYPKAKASKGEGNGNSTNGSVHVAVNVDVTHKSL